MISTTVGKPRVRVKAGSSIVTKGEGDYRPGPWYLPVTGGWLSDSNLNWWQTGANVQHQSPTALVEACVSAYAQTVAMCPGDHWRLKSDGGRERVKTSALARFLKSPNSYQTISDFMLNLTRGLYENGNAYALVLRNSRFEPDELHLMNPRGCAPIPTGTGDIFYSLTGNTIIDRIHGPLIVPARDVLHIRLNTVDYDPLRGVSPIVAAALDIAASGAIAAQQLSFYLNQARPSTVLSTDMILDKDQVDMLRERWNEQSRGMGAGGTPILTAGLKPVTISQSALDSQLAEMLKMTDQHIALAFRVPLAILGIGSGGMTNTEALMQGWLASSLGFILNHLEESIGALFNLAGQPDEYLELNTAALLRSNQKERMETLVRGVQGGVLSPNEARASEGYSAVKFGDEPRVQQQVVPLSAAEGIPTAPAAPSPDAAPAAPSPDAAPAAAPAAVKDLTDVAQQRIRKRWHSAHARQCSN